MKRAGLPPGGGSLSSVLIMVRCLLQLEGGQLDHFKDSP